MRPFRATIRDGRPRDGYGETFPRNLKEAIVLIFPTFYAMTGGLILQWLLGYNFSVAVWVAYIALFGIAVETGVVMVVYLHESLNKSIASGRPRTDSDIHEAAIEGAVHRLSPKLMTVCAVLASLIPILWASGIGSDVMTPIAAFMVGGMICVHNSRTDSGSGVLRVDEGTVSPAWYVTAEAGRVIGGKGTDDSATSSRT